MLAEQEGVRSGKARACGEAILARIDAIPAAADGFDPLPQGERGLSR
jgi:hypothetical protein